MNTKHLRKRRQGWAVSVTIPKHLQEKAAKYYGARTPRKREVVRGLNTRSLKEANERKIIAMAQIYKEFSFLSQNSRPDPLEIAKEFDPENELYYELISDLADEVREVDDYEAAKTYYQLATKQIVPISIHSSKWVEELKQDGLKLHTINDYNATMQMFIQWSDDIPVQRVDKALCSLFVQYLKTNPSPKTGRPLAVKTLKKKITALSSFWSWLDLNDFIKSEQVDLWKRQFAALSKIKRPKQKKRALTFDEAVKWLNAAKRSSSKYSQAMVDMLILGWHTGARAEDLCSLKLDALIEDTERKCIWMHVTDGKTNNNERLMPVISPEAIEVLTRRTAETNDNSLFWEIEPDTLYGQKYSRLQKTINPLRIKTLGNVDVDFHSLRRAFSVACEMAGTDPVQWARLMGHALPTLASSVYNQGHKAQDIILDYIRQVDPKLGELSD